MARRAGQIPLDDEPMEIDLGDLPSDEEFAAAEVVEDDDGGGSPATSTSSAVVEEPTVLGLFQTLVTLIAVLYFVFGWLVGLTMAFRGAAQLGLDALTHPSFYLVVLFWPIALWQLFWNQF